MSWFGVPFVVEEDWYGFKWSRAEFLNQFVRAAQMRIDAMRHVGVLDQVDLGLFEEGAPAQPAVFFNNFRRFGNYKVSGASGDRNPGYADLGGRPLAYTEGGRWFDKTKLVVGEPFAGQLDSGGYPAYPNDWFYFTPGGGLATTALLVRMNEILTGAGCPALQTTTPNADTDAMGIPWTRVYGADLGAPTVATGKALTGDWVGPWIFNELWALLLALDCLSVPRAWHEEHDLGSWRKVRTMGWSENQYVVDDSCGILDGAADSDATVHSDGMLLEVNRSVDRFVWADGEGSRTTTGSSQDVKARVYLDMPNIRAGDRFYMWANRYDSGSAEYTDVEGVGVANQEIAVLASFGDGEGPAIFEIGSTENLMPLVAACINPAAEDVGRNDSYYQRLLTGFAALECAFPDPTY